MKSRDDIEDEIEGHEAEIVKLKAQLVELDTMNPDQRLAERLHDTLCHWNHTDGCGWFYETDQPNLSKWTMRNHSEYLGHARKLMNFCVNRQIDVDDAFEIYTAVKSH